MTSRIHTPQWLRALPLATLFALLPAAQGGLTAASGPASVQSPNISGLAVATSSSFWFRQVLRRSACRNIVTSIGLMGASTPGKNIFAAT